MQRPRDSPLSGDVPGSHATRQHLTSEYEDALRYVSYNHSSDSRSEVVGREGRSNLWSRRRGRNCCCKSIGQGGSGGLSRGPNRKLAQSSSPGNLTAWL